VHSTADFNDEYFRIFGKIAFNVLAMIQGEEFVNEGHFDDVRKWIAYGCSNNFAAILQTNPLQNIGLPIPEDAHSILISRSGEMVVATVFLYNHFGVQILLSNTFNGELLIDGFICDWNNKKEFSFFEYLQDTRAPEQIEFD